MDGGVHDLPEQPLDTRQDASQNPQEAYVLVRPWQVLSPEEVQDKVFAIFRGVRAGREQALLDLIHQTDLCVSLDYGEGQTLLHMATIYGYIGVVNALISAGADLEAGYVFNETPMHLASQCGHREILLALINAGARVNAVSDYGITPLHRATEKRDPECIEALLAGGANPNAQDILGDTSLHRAAKRNNAPCVRVLLTGGADRSLRNRRGMSPSNLTSSRALRYILRPDPPGL